MRKDALRTVTLPVLLSFASLVPSVALAAKKKSKKAAPAASAPAGAAPAPDAPPPPPPEPEPPKKQVSAIQCQTPDEVKPDTVVTIRCSLKNGLKPSSVRIQYRAGGATDYTSIRMEKSQKGWWTADVPASAVKGKSIQYYVEAVGTTGDVIAANGRDDSPEIIYIVNPQPTAEATHQEVQPLAPPPPELRRKPGSWFGGLYLGHGYGWHPKSDLEYYNGEKAAAGGADEAGPGHIGLQAGYQLTDELAFSLVTRSQYIPKSGNDPNRTGHPANGAHALLVKGEYDFAGEQHLFYAGGMLGVGAFRLGFEPNTDRGILTNDTVKGGPILLGPMGGAMYNFKGHLTAFGELGVLFGIGDSALIADLNIGLQYRL